MHTDRIKPLIAELLPELVDLRHDLHAHPELGYEEQRTSSVVLSHLQKAGIETVTGLAGGTGILGHIPGHGDAAIGLRADMDALPMPEQTGLPYASTHEGKMHACGHDGHVTMLVGAARVLAKLGPLPNPVTLLFQPAEEGGGGGARMVADGCLTGERIGKPVKHVFGLHGWPDLPLGKVATRVGPLLAAQARFSITIRGTGCHAAWPQVGRDPVVAGAAIVTALQQIVARNVNPLAAVVVSVTQFHAGTATNVIPDYAELHGTSRWLDPEGGELARERLTEIATLVGQAHGCEVEVDYRPGYPVTINHPEAVAYLTRYAAPMFGSDGLVTDTPPVMGAEDFAYYGQQIPCCFSFLGLHTDKRNGAQLHQPEFDFNDEAIPLGIELLCRLALGAA